MEVRCEWCGQLMEVHDLRRKYHKINPDGILCALEAQRLKTRTRQREYTKRTNQTEQDEKVPVIG